MIQTYTALNNQTIYDVCLMTYGTLDKLFKLLQDNDFGGVNNYPFQGQQFAWDDTLVFNNQVNITNKLVGTNYATASSSTGNINYTIQTNGLPVSGNPIPSPVPPIVGRFDYFLVYSTDIRLSGGLTFTDPYLKGKRGYAVYAQQLSQFFSLVEAVDLHYNSTDGSFTILTPGFSLVGGYYLVIYPNKYDTSISSNPGDYYDVFNTDTRLSGLTFSDPGLINKSGYAIYSEQLDQFFSITNGVDVTYNSIAGSFTIIVPGYSFVAGECLLVYPNKYDIAIP